MAAHSHPQGGHHHVPVHRGGVPRLWHLLEGAVGRGAAASPAARAQRRQLSPRCAAWGLQVVEYSLQYDGAGTPVELSSCMLSGAGGRQCQLSFNIQERMKAPVYVYYELDNFYQNHRRYVKSRSDAQLRGQELPASSLSDCEPLIRNETGHVLNPCGLIANSFFNGACPHARPRAPCARGWPACAHAHDSRTDTFLVATGGVVMDETGIAWKSDREKKFKKPAVYLPTVHYLHQTYPSIITPEQGVENEHFIVWMRTAALPNFRKLYGRIEQDLDANTVLTFNVTASACPPPPPRSSAARAPDASPPRAAAQTTAWTSSAARSRWSSPPRRGLVAGTPSWASRTWQ